jgi:hypothetical protein
MKMTLHKCVHNGRSPSSLNYKTFEDICQHIKTEMKMIGTCDTKLANEVKKYLTINPAIFSTDFYSNYKAEVKSNVQI